MGLMEVVAIGDPHFGSKTLAKLYPNITHLQIAEISKAFDYAISRSIKNVFILGDIFDSPNVDSHVFSDVFKFFWSYKDSPIIISMILGNHDIETTEKNSLNLLKFLSDMSVIDNVRVCTEHTLLNIEGIDFEFMPFPIHEPLRKNSVCVAHVERPLSIRDNGTRSSGECGYKQNNTNFFIMGHLHTHQTNGLTKYPGTMYQMNFGESLDKGFGHFIFTKKKKEFHFIPNVPAFQLRTITKPLPKLNSKFRYRLITEKEIPKDYLKNNPCIVKFLSRDTKQLVDLVVEEKVEYTIFDGLPEFLRAKKLTPNQIKEGVKIVRRLQRGKQA
jgi:DNA repair exonuclease SbcCD nuclease subunit